MIKNEIFYEAAAEEGAFNSPLRNIRLQLDGRNAVFDLIPSVVLDKPTKILDPDFPPELNNILSGARPVVKSKRFMRVYFECIMAVSIQEEFVDIISILDDDLDSAPRLSDRRAPYPFLKVINSNWKNCLPDYQGRDDQNMAHFKIVSMETCIDVLGYLEKIEWLEK
jgi:hypothetical protein